VPDVLLVQAGCDLALQEAFAYAAAFEVLGVDAVGSADGATVAITQICGSAGEGRCAYYLGGSDLAVAGLVKPGGYRCRLVSLGAAAPSSGSCHSPGTLLPWP